MDDKQTLRQIYRRIRSLAAQQNPHAAENLCRHMFSLACFTQSKGVLLFASAGSEPPTDTLIEACLAAGKRVALPRCLGAGEMQFYEIDSLEQLQAGAFGIREPLQDRPKVTDFDVFSFCVVPGLAFDCFGGRLGYGGGYYDRFLATYGGHTAALAYEATVSAEALPRQAYDRVVEWLITEKGAEKVNGYVF